MLRKLLSLLAGFVFLLGLAMMYASSPRLSELVLAAAIAVLGVIGSAIIRASGLGAFEFRARWLALAFLEPWYVLVGSWRLAASLVRKLIGKRSRARFHAIAYDPGGDDVESETRRTLTIAYLTVPPDSIVIGIDRHANELLLHEIQPMPVPLPARKLGAKE